MKFIVERREHLYGQWEIEANSIEEAEDKWEAMTNNGEVDYSDMELYDSENHIFEKMDFKKMDENIENHELYGSCESCKNYGRGLECSNCIEGDGYEYDGSLGEEWRKIR